MKKSIYPPCLILFVLLLVPVTACTTKAAAEKPQDTPSRQEQPAAKGASHTGDMMSPQSAPTETQPSKSATQPDAVSGATIDTVSGATVSQRQKKTPASEAVGADKDMATGGAAVSQKQHTTAASPALAAADMSVPAKIAGEAEPTTAAAENIAAPAAADTAAEQIPTAPSTGEPVPLVAADTSATSAKQNVPAYETTLADLISDFEKQGGSHGYERRRPSTKRCSTFFLRKYSPLRFQKNRKPNKSPRFRAWLQSKKSSGWNSPIRDMAGSMSASKPPNRG